MSLRIVASILFLLPTLPLNAQVTWTGNADTQWSNPENWWPGKRVPTAESSVILPKSGESTIELGEPSTLHELSIAGDYTLTGNGPLQFEGFGGGISVTETATIDVPIVLNGRTIFESHDNSELRISQDIDVNRQRLTLEGHLVLDEANVNGTTFDFVNSSEESVLSGTGTVEPNFSGRGTISPDPQLTFSHDASIDKVELDIVSESSFDIVSGGGQGALEIRRLVLDVTSIPDINSDLEFQIFPDWVSVSVAHVATRDFVVEWDEEQLSQGILKIDLSEPILCDLDLDGLCGVSDLDVLGGFIRTAQYGIAADLNSDNKVDLADRDEWISMVGKAQGFTYYLGDANFDGQVNATDLMTIGQNWQLTDVSSYSNGDFNFDGVVDALDLNEVGKNWQAGARSSVNTVPEPAAHLLVLLAATAMFKALRNRPGKSLCILLAVAVTTRR